MGMGTAQRIEDDDDYELCPSCGDFVDVLLSETGWCYSCSGIAPPNRCIRCNTLTDRGKHCRSCAYILWLLRNADQIEEIMAELTLPASKAKRVCEERNRPNCLCCKQPIKGGQRWGKPLFCTNTEACIKARHTYHWHYRIQRRSKEESITRALTAALAYKLMNGIEQ